MGFAKTDEFTVRDNNIARIAKALAHPARIAIIRLLLENKSCMCGNIVEVLPLSQSTVSQHLKELKDADIITGDITGTKVCYCINPKMWKQTGELFRLFFSTKVKGKNCC
ncbi:MAG: winged helix-turn-helix transcriptional regulator [Bacteroidetes bacterium]|nr:winged helix-turn-helix transcriptional regulator [Bacteroidota bacterium]